MIKPDVIVSWPQHLDYPLWRKYIHDFRDHFNKVIVVFTQMNAGPDYRTWLQDQLNKDQIISITNDEVLASKDWRNVAVNKGLGLSDSEWIWFTEQDFIPEFGFWSVLYDLATVYRAVGVKQSDRLHPCSLFLRRDLLQELDKNFGVTKDLLDHFGMIQKQLEEKKEKVAIIDPTYWYHYNGLSQNMYLLQIGEKPNYEPKKFKEYCKKCLEVGTHPDFEELFKKYELTN